MRRLCSWPGQIGEVFPSAPSRPASRACLRDLAAAAGAPDPGQLASQIHLLYDGAMLAASLDGNPGVTAASRSAAEALLDAALFGAAPLSAPLFDATRLHPAASPGAGGGRHRKPDQPAASPGL
jgi:hypothetical protein